MPRSRLTVLFSSVMLIVAMTFTTPTASAESDYMAVIGRQEELVLRFLRAFESLQEELHPARFVQQQSALRAFGDEFARLRSELETMVPPPERSAFHRTWVEAIGLLDTTYGVFVGSDPSAFIAVFIRSRDAFAQARYLLYGIRKDTPTVQAYWVALKALANLPELERRRAADDVEVGIVRRPPSSAHGAYSLYVPENYTPEWSWPLIVALHGGSGADDEYLLTWLRPAKSSGYLILSPRSLGFTWAIDKPAADVSSIASMLASVRERYAIDADRILLSGLSDGGTFAYALAMSRPDLFAAVAPVAGVLPPSSDLRRASALPFLIVHGGQDFIFPVETARMAHATLLEQTFASVTYRELPEWGHAYTYSINEGIILPWFKRLQSGKEEAPKDH